MLSAYKDAGRASASRIVETTKVVGTDMPTWCFKSAAQLTAEAAHHWYWQIDTQHALIAITSPRLFPTIEECIADAREHGFRGDVEIPEEVTHPALITCEEGDYVHAIVQRSVSARSQMRAV